MMDKKMLSLLNDSLAELDVRINDEKTLSIVEFCLEYTNLRGQELIYFCEDMIKSSIPSIVLTESAFSNVGDRIKHTFNTVTQGRGASRDAEKTNSKPLSGSLLRNRAQQAGNWFGTRASQVRNSAMIEIAGGKGEATRYLVFPDLDMSRPGHPQILQSIIDKENKEGKSASEIPPNDERRANIASRATEVRLPDAASGKNKAAVVKALDDLSKYANQQKLAFSRYNFVAPEEVQGIVDYSSKLFQNIASAAKAGGENTAEELTAAGDDKLKAAGPGGPNAVSAGIDSAKESMTANIGPAKTSIGDAVDQETPEPKGKGLLDAAGNYIPEPESTNPSLPIKAEIDGAEQSLPIKPAGEPVAKEGAPNVAPLVPQANQQQYSVNPGIQSAAPGGHGQTYRTPGATSIPSKNPNLGVQGGGTIGGAEEDTDGAPVRRIRTTAEHTDPTEWAQV